MLVDFLPYVPFFIPRHCRTKKQGKIKFLFTFIGYNNLKEKTY